LGKLNSLECNKTDEDAINDILAPVKDDTNDQTYENELKSDDNSDCSESDDALDEDDDDDDDDDDGDSGWITPQNIAHKKQQITSEADDKPVKVACITADFAMQVS
jgi:rRNA maturation endonuclease Nob1